MTEPLPPAAPMGGMVHYTPGPLQYTEEAYVIDAWMTHCHPALVVRDHPSGAHLTVSAHRGAFIARDVPHASDPTPGRWHLVSECPGGQSGTALPPADPEGGDGDE